MSELLIIRFNGYKLYLEDDHSRSLSRVYYRLPDETVSKEFTGETVRFRGTEAADIEFLYILDARKSESEVRMYQVWNETIDPTGRSTRRRPSGYQREQERVPSRHSFRSAIRSWQPATPRHEEQEEQKDSPMTSLRKINDFLQANSTNRHRHRL